MLRTRPRGWPGCGGGPAYRRASSSGISQLADGGVSDRLDDPSPIQE